MKMATHRIQFDLTQQAFDEMESLQAESKCSTRAELIRKALRMFAYNLFRVRQKSVTAFGLGFAAGIDTENVTLGLAVEWGHSCACGGWQFQIRTLVFLAGMHKHVD